MTIQVYDANSQIKTMKSRQVSGEEVTSHDIERMPWPTAVACQSVYLTTQNTQYQLTVPAGTKRFSFKLRTMVTLRYAFETGKVAGMVEPYMTLAPGAVYDSGFVRLDAGLTIYFASSSAAQPLVELEAWT